MAVDPLTAILNVGQSVIERIWPDATKRAEEMRKLEEIKQRGDLAELEAHVKMLSGQLEVNKMEAKHASVFVAGWRPFIGWVGGIALGYQFILYPLLIWLWTFLQAGGLIAATLGVPPILDTGALFSLITAMLGIGAMRSFDKTKSTDTKEMK